METNGTQRAVLACTFFLYTGFIGAVALAAGLIQVFAGETTGLGLVVFGGILATASWCRAWTVVEAGNRAPVVKAHPGRLDLRSLFAGSPNIPASR